MNVMRNLSTTAFLNARRAVGLATIAPVFAAGVAMSWYAALRLFAVGEEARHLGGLALRGGWCAFVVVLYVVIVRGTTGAERRGTLIAGILFAPLLWVPSSALLVILSGLARLAVAQLFRS
jgi:hypothetical protein